MKNILLLAHDDEGQEARLQAALDVTRAVEGHLTCLDVTVPPVALAYGAYNAMIAPELVAYEHNRDVANRTRLEEKLTHEGVAWDWHETAGLLEESIEASAGLSDLIVLSCQLSDVEPMELRRLVGQVAEKSHRPVLAVPKDSSGLDLCGTVIVAWDGSRQADEALRSAVPLLKLSADVILLDLDEPDGSFAATTAATYLSRHDVHARIEIAQRKAGWTIYTAILERAHESKAAYIVMGAFGHSATVETIFGGVTRSMLAQSDIPLLLAH